MVSNSLLMWLGFFLSLAIIGVTIRKPTIGKEKNGKKDYPQRTKPLFKFASMCIFITLITMFIFAIKY